jgi:peptidoglycan/LPS O-acetylase OafA/YrhL
MPRLLTLQVARGVAANLVVLAHLAPAERLYTVGNLLPQACDYGSGGADLFFVLSGCIMTAVAGRNVTALQFLWQRAARIYPPYWLVSVATIAFVAAGLVHSPSIANSLWRSFLLVPDTTPPVIIVAWTLVFEVYFYAVFAIFLAFSVPIVSGLIAWSAVIVALNLIAADQFAGTPVLALAASPLTAEFIMGGIVGLLWLSGRMPLPLISPLLGLAIFGISAHFFGGGLRDVTDPHRVLLYGIPSALFLYLLMSLELRKQRPQPPRLFTALGDWSYGTYLTHVMVLSAIGRAVAFLSPAGSILTSLFFIIVGLIAVNLVGAMLHMLFERPTLLVLRRLGSAILSPSLADHP